MKIVLNGYHNIDPPARFGTSKNKKGEVSLQLPSPMTFPTSYFAVTDSGTDFDDGGGCDDVESWLSWGRFYETVSAEIYV
jgi:hypothetical protein